MTTILFAPYHPIPDDDPALLELLQPHLRDDDLKEYQLKDLECWEKCFPAIVTAIEFHPEKLHRLIRYMQRTTDLFPVLAGHLLFIAIRIGSPNNVDYIERHHAVGGTGNHPSVCMPNPIWSVSANSLLNHPIDAIMQLVHRGIRKKDPFRTYEVLDRLIFWEYHFAVEATPDELAVWVSCLFHCQSTTTKESKVERSETFKSDYYDSNFEHKVVKYQTEPDPKVLSRLEKLGILTPEVEARLSFRWR